MQSEGHGFEVIGDLRWRAWDGVVADIWTVDCAADAGGSYLSPDPRLFVVLDINKGGALELSVSGQGSSAIHRAPLSLAYIPAGVAVRSRALEIGQLRHLDIHMSEAALVRKFGKALDPVRLAMPRLQFNDGRIAAIAALLADECASDTPLHDRYGDSLVDALLCALFEVRREVRRARPGLSRAQLRQSIDYIEARSFETIRLQDMAALFSLSESYFSHAFKASTGIPPLRWQMNARVGKVKELLSTSTQTLTEVAATAGFSDQAHLSRVFKRVTGMTPAEWRRHPAAVS